MMMFLLLDAFILGAILYLVYLLWKVFYETKEVSAGLGPKRRKYILPAVTLLTILSATLLASKCVGPALTVVTQAFSGRHLIEGTPRAEERLDKEDSLISQDISSVLDDGTVRVGEIFEGTSIGASERRPCREPNFTYNAADDFDLGGSPPSSKSN